MTVETKIKTGVQHLGDQGMNAELIRQGYPKLPRLPSIGAQFAGGTDRILFGGDMDFTSLHYGDQADASNNNLPNFSRYSALSFGPMIRFYAFDSAYFRWDLHAGGLFAYNLATLHGRKNGTERDIDVGYGSYGYYGTGFSVGLGSESLYLTLEIDQRSSALLSLGSIFSGNSSALSTDGLYTGLSITFTNRHRETKTSETRSVAPRKSAKQNAKARHGGKPKPPPPPPKPTPPPAPEEEPSSDDESASSQAAPPPAPAAPEAPPAELPSEEPMSPAQE